MKLGRIATALILLIAVLLMIRTLGSASRRSAGNDRTTPVATEEARVTNILRESRTSTAQSSKVLKTARLTTASLAGPPPAALHIRGQVVSRRNDPLSGTLLTLTIMHDGHTSTIAMAHANQRGLFSLQPVPLQSSYKLAATLAGYAPAEHQLAPENVMVLQEFFVLSPAAELSGRVLDAETSAPIVDAIVHRPAAIGTDPNDTPSTITDTSGAFVFADAPAGTVRLIVEKPGYETQLVERESPSTTCVLELRAGGGGISGTVTGAPPDQMLKYKIVLSSADSELRFEQPMSGNSFAFKNLPAGAYELRAEGEVLGTPINLSLARDEQKSGVRLELPHDVLIAGQCTESGTGAPVEGVQLAIAGQGADCATLSGADGKFILHGLSPIAGEVRLTVQRDGFTMVDPNEPAQEHLNGGEMVVRITNGAAANQLIQLRRVPRLFGRVVTASGSPVPGAQVQLRWLKNSLVQPANTVTDPEGQFSFNTSPEADGTAWLGAHGELGGAVKEVKLPAEQPVTLQLNDRALKAQLLLSDGTPLSDAPVLALTAPFGPPSDELQRLPGDEVETGPDGSFVVRGFDPARDFLEFRLPIDATFQVRVDTSRPLVFVYDPVQRTLKQQEIAPRNNAGEPTV